MKNKNYYDVGTYYLPVQILEVKQRNKLRQKKSYNIKLIGHSSVSHFSKEI